MHSQLNDEQRRIVLEGDGAVLVVAGPGSGKTRTLVHRVCHLLSKGEDPGGILLLTFTNKASREMISRVDAIAGKSSAGILAGTFHHFAVLILRRHAPLLGFSSNFTILDEQDSKSVLKSLVEQNHGKTKKGVIDDVQRAISISHLKMMPIEDLLMEEPELHALSRDIEGVSRIASEFAIAKKSMDAMDFDDLLVHLHALLSGHPDIRKRYQERFRHILVDEFQDTDRIQASLIGLLHLPGKDLMAVGDDSQSIYSFRGATIENILTFQKRYDAKVLYLVRNYRSTAPIISLINSAIASSRQKIEKKLLAIRPGGKLPELLRARDRSEEAALVADRIQSDLEEGRSVGVLFRASYLSSELELELTRRKIDYDLRGGLRFFEQRHIKDIVSPLRLLSNPKDRTALVRMLLLFPGIGQTRVSKAVQSASTLDDSIRILSQLEKTPEFSSMLRDMFASSKSPAYLLDRFFTSFYRSYMEKEFDDFEERKTDIDALMGAAVRFEDVSEFIETLTLDPDSHRKGDKRLVLSTIHQAKGLEWDSVVIMGMADGMLPLARSGDIEEERRLFYVAASRAKDSLVMTYPLVMGRFFDSFETEPSRFLDEIPAELFQAHDHPAKAAP